MKLTNNQKIWTGVGSFAFIVVTAIGIKKYKNNKNNDFDDLIIPPTNNVSFPLKYGDNNALVKRIQKWLNRMVIVPNKKIQAILGVTKLKEDGQFGKNTLKAVKVTFKTEQVSKSYFDKVKA